MKKAPLVSVLVICFVLAVSISVTMSYSLQRGEEAFILRDPIDITFLIALGDRLRNEEATLRSPQSSPPSHADQPLAGTLPNYALLPNHLERTVTRQRLAQKRMDRQYSERLEALFRVNTLKIEAGISGLLGKESLNGIHTPAAIGYELMRLGRFEEAQRYLWKAVEGYERTDPTQCKVAMRALAWLEEDQVMAAHLLHVSCQGEFTSEGLLSSNLLSAYELCMETESTELAAHYLMRLRAECPEDAAEYHSWGWIPAEGSGASQVPEQKNGMPVGT